MTDKKVGVVRYENVGDDYLQQRQLKRSAGWVLLWALGVGAVISGDFGGWQYGLASGGFGGLALATLLMAVMYVCMIYSIAELSAALPHAGGFFSFTRNAFGPTGGFLCGLTDTIEYVLTPAVIVYFIGNYVHELALQVESIFGAAPTVSLWPLFAWWLLFYAVFVAINIRGTALTLKVGLLVTLTAIAVLVVFYVGALVSGAFDPALLTNIEPQEGATSRWLPFGSSGIFASLPFAIWFFLAIEQLPLAAEESNDVVADMPRAMILGIATLLVLALLTLVLNTGVGGGAAHMQSSDTPLADGFVAIFGAGAAPALLTLVGLTGLVASFHTVIYAYGRVLFALSRAGYIPRVLSLTGRWHTPYVALLAGAIVGLCCTAVLEYTKQVPVATSAGTELQAAPTESVAGQALLNMTVFGAVLSYAMVMASYIKLRIDKPELPRPYRSPLGIPGALVGLILSIVALLATFANEDYRPAVWGTAIFVLVGIVYFFAYSRHHLIAQAPEEENALIAEAARELAHQ